MSVFPNTYARCSKYGLWVTRPLSTINHFPQNLGHVSATIRRTMGSASSHIMPGRRSGW